MKILTLVILLIYIFSKDPKILCSVLSRHWVEGSPYKAQRQKPNSERRTHGEWPMLPLVSKAQLPGADVHLFVASFHTLKSLLFPLIFSLGYQNANSIIPSAHSTFSKSSVIALLRQIKCAYIFLEVHWSKQIQYLNFIIQNKAKGSTPHLPDYTTN